MLLWEVIMNDQWSIMNYEWSKSLSGKTRMNQFLNFIINEDVSLWCQVGRWWIPATEPEYTLAAINRSLCNRHMMSHADVKDSNELYVLRWLSAGTGIFWNVALHRHTDI